MHRLDAARLYRLALEQGMTSPVYHAVAAWLEPTGPDLLTDIDQPGYYPD